MFGNPFFGKMSDRTSSQLGMRRPWMVIGLVGGSLGILVVALAPNIAVVLIGWCIAQLLFNALLAAEVAVLPDQVPAAQRGLVAGVLGVCVPIASVSGTFLVKLFAGSQLAMFLAPCAIGGIFVLLFAVTLKDRRLAKEDKPVWSLREFASTFYVNPRRNPDFAWAFASRFMFVLAYAFLATYQAYYLRFPHRRQTFRPNGPEENLRAHRVDRVRRGDDRDRRRQQLQRLSRRHGHRRTRLRQCMAVDLAFVVDVLPDKDTWPG
jgi:MFS family permease